MVSSMVVVVVVVVVLRAVFLLTPHSFSTAGRSSLANCTRDGGEL
jgi:hypothetical protein